jgi:hypothetical protein
MPYSFFFSKHQWWPVYTLAYLYTFIRAHNHTKLISHHFAKLLVSGSHAKVDNCIANSDNIDVGSPIKEVVSKII